MTGGFAGGQAEFVRVPFADVGALKVPDHLTDEQVLFLSDIFPTGFMGADMCEIKPGHVVAVWGAGPVGQLAIASARLLGAERIIAIDRFPYRLKMAVEQAGATTSSTTTRSPPSMRSRSSPVDVVPMRASMQSAWRRTATGCTTPTTRASR